jgi:hypothetical protein
VRPTVIYIDPQSFDPARNSVAVRERLAIAPFHVHVLDFRIGIEASFDESAGASTVRSWFNVN